MAAVYELVVSAAVVMGRNDGRFDAAGHGDMNERINGLIWAVIH